MWNQILINKKMKKSYKSNCIKKKKIIILNSSIMNKRLNKLKNLDRP